MADGSQRGFPFPRLHASRLRSGEIVVDLFAGGGGASTGLEQALGRPVDIAVNHNPWWQAKVRQQLQRLAVRVGAGEWALPEAIAA